MPRRSNPGNSYGKDPNYNGPGKSYESKGDRPTSAPKPSNGGTTSKVVLPKTPPPESIPPANPKIIITTDSATFDNGVQDVSIIPYMRSQHIRFTASGLRPERRVWFFFDDVDVTDYIIPPNEISLNEDDNVSSFNDGFSDADEIIVSSNTQNKSFIHSNKRRFDLNNANPALQDKGRDVPRKRILSVSNVSGSIAISSTIQGSVTGNVGTVNSVLTIGDHNLDKFFDNSNARFITLPPFASSMANNYWGTGNSNTIVLIPKNKKRGRAIRGYIAGWDNVSRRLTLANTIGDLITEFNYTDAFPSANSGNTIGKDIAWKIENDITVAPGLYTDREGTIDGTFFIPPNFFRTGERIFRIIDTPQNDVADCTTRAEIDFVASGLKQTKNRVTINDTDVTVVPPSVPRPPVPPPPPPPPPPRPPTPPPLPPPKRPPITPPRNSDCCFIPYAMVSMADGSKKPICEIRVGDEVLSKNGMSRVTDLIITHLGDRELYGFAGHAPFATEDHPFLTNKGWSAYKIGEYHNHLVRDNVENINWDPMTTEETVLHKSGFVPVDNIVTEAGSVNQLVYALTLDDSSDHTYWVEDFLTHNKGGDPIAQTFFVEEGAYPNGVFITAIDIYFRTKDPVLPVNVEIRPTVNGFPHSIQMIPFSKKTMKADKVRVSENASVPTKFTFNSPVYLEPGEYAIVITSSSLAYEVFVSEVGEKIIGTNRIVSSQPYLGSFFKSQNASTWDPIQLDDLTFKLYKAKFVTSGDVTMYNVKPTNTVNVDMMYSHVDDTTLPTTAISYTHSYDSGANYYSYIPDTNKVPDDRVTFGTASDGSYRLKAVMTTTNQDVSPILYTDRAGVVAVENYIDNATLANDDILITAAGFGYASNANISVSITSTEGSGANAFATTNTTGSIVSITLDNPGSAYINTASIVFNSSNATTTNASAIIVGENSSSGGPVLAKYISRTVTLADTFDAGDLRVFVTAYRPPGTNIYVYYKVKNVNDSDSFSNKSWVLMNQETLQSLYSSKKVYNQIIEYEFRPKNYPNAISYSTTSGSFDTFKQFAIKIVMTTSDTTTYPVLHDMRAIALPAMSQ